MRYIKFGIMFIVLLSAGLAKEAPAIAFSTANDHQPTLQLVDSPIDEAAHSSLPHKKQPNDIRDVERSAPKAAAKPLTNVEIVMDVGTTVIKNAGAVENYFNEVGTGYKKIYNDGLIQANDKRMNRIARGQTTNFFTDFVDGFTSTLIPSAKFTIIKIGLPVLNMFGRIYFGIKIPA